MSSQRTVKKRLESNLEVQKRLADNTPIMKKQFINLLKKAVKPSSKQSVSKAQ